MIQSQVVKQDCTGLKQIQYSLKGMNISLQHLQTVGVEMGEPRRCIRYQAFRPSHIQICNFTFSFYANFLSYLFILFDSYLNKQYISGCMFNLQRNTAFTKFLSTQCRKPLIRTKNFIRILKQCQFEISKVYTIRFQRYGAQKVKFVVKTQFL